MKYFLLTLSLLLITLGIEAQSFEDYFINKTLRLDYIFSGNSTTQSVSVDQLNQLPIWAGRKNHLSELLRDGNGQIRLIDPISGKCIYTDSFSTLFQEWQTTPEAKTIRRSFENTFLVPLFLG